MKKTLLSILFTTIFICSSVNAETTKAKDANKTMTNDEFMKEFMRLDNEIEIKKKKTEELKALNKTLDKALDLVNTKK